MHVIHKNCRQKAMHTSPYSKDPLDRWKIEYPSYKQAKSFYRSSWKEIWNEIWNETTCCSTEVAEDKTETAALSGIHNTDFVFHV